MITREHLNALRMADLLWERYCEVGFGVALAAFRADDQSQALMHTALATYKQFCRRHGLATGLSQ